MLNDKYMKFLGDMKAVKASDETKAMLESITKGYILCEGEEGDLAEFEGENPSTVAPIGPHDDMVKTEPDAIAETAPVTESETEQEMEPVAEPENETAPAAKEKFVTIENIPDWAIYYMVYGEGDDLTDEDKAEVDEYMKANGLRRAVSVDEESKNDFCANPEFGKGSGTYTVTFATEDTDKPANPVEQEPEPVVDSVVEPESDIAEVSEEADAETEEKPNVKVSLWSGAGVDGDSVEVYVDGGRRNAMAALELAVAKIEKAGDTHGVLIDEDQLDEEERESDYYIYVDATMAGATKPYYVNSTLNIEDI